MNVKSLRLIALFATLFCLNIAHAQTQASTWEHLGLGVGGLLTNWRDTPDQAREKMKSSFGPRMKFVGESNGTQLYEIPHLSFSSRDNSAGQPLTATSPDDWLLRLIFRGGKLDEFELRPMNERADSIIGIENLMPALDVLVKNSRWSDDKPRWRNLNSATVIYEGGPQLYLADAPLGFEINTTQWSEYGVYHRIIVASDDAGKSIRLLRHQARPDRPFETPIEGKLAIKNGERALLGAAVLGNIGVSLAQLDAILKKPALFGVAPKPLALKIAEMPPPARDGKRIGFFGYRFGMSAGEIAAMPTPDAATARAVNSARKNTESLIMGPFTLTEGSRFEWDLQFWVGKKGLSEFELRPHAERSSAQLIGAPDALNGMDELRLWSAQMYHLGPDDWWQDYSNATGTQRGWGSSTSTVDTPASTYLIPGGEHPFAPAGYGMGFTSASSYQVTRSYRTKFKVGIPLDFNVKERAFHVGDIFFRQAWLSGKVGQVALNTVRLQGRNEGGDWAPIAPQTFKNTDKAAAQREVLRYYNVGDFQNLP